MKKTLIAVLCVAFLSTGAMAKPMHHNTPHHGGGHTTVQVINTGHHGGRSQHAPHHRPSHHVAYSAPRRHHHSHDNINLLGDALIAFAILAVAQ